VNAPLLSWFPVRHLVAEVAGRGVGTDWIADAARFGFGYVELHELYIRTGGQESRVARQLEAAGVAVSQVTCAPNFVSDDPDERAHQLDLMRRNVAAAARLGARSVRVTAGIDFEGLSTADGIERTTALVRSIAEEAAGVDVLVLIENHYRDRTWPEDALDFSLPPDRFLDLVDALRDTPALVNFDTAQTMLAGIDPLVLLTQVDDRVANVHAGDRRHGQRQHTVIGAGDVDFDAVFGRLAARGYDGFVTVEDGSVEGDDGLVTGIRTLSELIIRHWGRAPL